MRDLVETQDVVFSVAFSPDNKKIATAGADRTIRIFEVETGKLAIQIEDHADWIFGVAWSPDGKRLASASRDKTAKVFDVEKKESLVTFPGHAQPVYTVSFAPDGKGIATGGEDNRIRIWNPDNDGKPIRDMGGFGGTVFKLRYASDGKSLVACSGDKTVSVFSATGSQSASCKATTTGSTRWRSHRDGKTIASGSWDGEVRLWNLADGKVIRSFIAAPGTSPRGQRPRDGDPRGLLVGGVGVRHAKSSRIGWPPSTSANGSPSRRARYVAGIDAQAVIDRRQHVLRCNRPVGGIGGVRIACCPRPGRLGRRRRPWRRSRRPASGRGRRLR